MSDEPNDSPKIFNAFMRDLAAQMVPIIVPLIVDELRAQTNAEGMGLIALDPNNLSLPVHSLLTEDANTKEAIKGILEEHYDDTISDLTRRLDKLESQVSDHDDKIDELETETSDNKVDADNHEFADAVIAVLRKSI